MARCPTAALQPRSVTYPIGAPTTGTILVNDVSDFSPAFQNQGRGGHADGSSMDTDDVDIVRRLGICPTCQRWTYESDDGPWRHGEDNTVECQPRRRCSKLRRRVMTILRAVHQC